MSFFNTITSRLDDLNLGGSKKSSDDYSGEQTRISYLLPLQLNLSILCFPNTSP